MFRNCDAKHIIEDGIMEVDAYRGQEVADADEISREYLYNNVLLGVFGRARLGSYVGSLNSLKNKGTY